MAKFTKRQVKNIILFAASILFAHCANQLPPGGGDIDKVPPRILEVFPENETTNYNEDYFELEFSEYIDKRSLQDAIFISPALDQSLELNWSGKRVEVTFPEKLKENTTYVVTIGTDVVDYNNKNRMAQSYIFTFSTGSEIDKRVVMGNIYSEKPSGVLIFAYKLTSDTANVLINKPDFISQAGDDGSFKLMGLAEGKYRIFAVKDEFHDLIFQLDQDLIGIPFKDINFSKQDSLFEGLNFFLTKIDTIKPRILSANMTDKNHILINFSEEFDSSIIKASNFYIYDSTANKKINPVYAFKGLIKPTEMVLAVNGNFSLDNNVFLFADSIKDQQGNIYISDYTSINLSDRLDTNQIEISKIDPPARSENVDFTDQKFFFYFNDALNIDSAKKAIVFSDTMRNKIPFSLKFVDDASFEINALKNLEPEKNYIISIDLSKFKNIQGKGIDTVFDYKFKTFSGLDFTGIMGNIFNADLNKNPVIVLESIDEKKIIYKTKPKADSKYGFDRIQPGKYLLWCFLDEDSSGTYSYGYPFPFKPSEKFSFYPDTLNLRARWVQTDINFRMK